MSQGQKGFCPLPAPACVGSTVRLGCLCMHNLQELIQTGGITLAAIAVLSVLATVVLIERIVATAGIREEVRTVADALIKLLYQGEVDQARALSQKTTTPPMSMFA